MKTLLHGPNIVSFYDIFETGNPDTPHAIVMEYAPQSMKDRREMYARMTLQDIRFVIMEVLRALDYAHSRGIFHRDVKPSNIMIDLQGRSVRLIDWGLAEFYLPPDQKLYNTNVCTKAYKGPELLVGLRAYDYSLDIWSLGLVLAELVFKRGPLFKGTDNHEVLSLIAQQLGTSDVLKFC
jgi:casein kinase II subunit alpha